MQTSKPKAAGSDIRKRCLLAATLLLIALPGSVGAASSEALDYRETLARMLTSHKRIAGAQAEVEAADAGVSKAQGAWYPDLAISSKAGHHNVRRTGDYPETNLTDGDLNLSVRQPLWDFGQIGGAIGKSEVALQQAKVGAAVVRMDLLLEGVTAFINFDRTERSVEFARQSVANIRRQTGLEQSRVEIGGGSTSDVLQAKSQLAGAQARLAVAEGAQAIAGNRFRALFGHVPAAGQARPSIRLPQDLLPATIDDAIAIARTRNPQLELVTLGVSGNQAEIDRIRGSELFPKLSGVAETRLQHNPSGAYDRRAEQLLMFEMSYQFNTGLSAKHSVDAARQTLRASQYKLDDTRTNVEEQVYNAWQNLETARRNADYLGNQVYIVGEFLRLAREERVQGRRSLIDILSGETTLINAQSDAASAEADVAIAGFSLLRSIGVLDLDIFP